MRHPIPYRTAYPIREPADRPLYLTHELRCQGIGYYNLFPDNEVGFYLELPFFLG